MILQPRSRGDAENNPPPPPPSASPRLGGENHFGFNPALGRRLCQLSAAAYLPGLAPETREIESGDGETRAVISLLGESIAVAFRGTRDLRNWITDIDCLQTGYPIFDWGACRLHTGFWRAWLAVEQKLWTALAALDTRPATRNTRIFYTGHSLGGALAMIAADRFRRAFHRQPIVYTFGQPRVGNPYWARMYDLSLKAFTWRVVHADDIVPRVPWLLGDFRHCGQEAFYGPPQIGRAEQRAQAGISSPFCLRDALDNFRLNPGVLEKIPWDARNAARELRSGKLALLADHHVDSYLALFK